MDVAVLNLWRSIVVIRRLIMWKGISARLSFTVIGIAALATTSAVCAEPLEMISYSNVPGGPEIAAGDYVAAIETASSRLWRLNTDKELVANTNLCIAYTVTGDFDSAEEACDAALSVAEQVDRAARKSGLRLSRHEATARALTNRGVLRAMAGNALLAAADFRAAERISGAWTVPGRNLEHLESSDLIRPALAATE
jgi:hypothetical protein